ncbi:C-C motif chemokine 5-like [Podarcis lilfordi]|uniref:C-C motif chemokine 5-like n=1 Tax=Podarcis lilfordi TaxID=74358 RepID=A0AA35LF30_9SAUR|nr:C-C motif chemokine 5-like [Podarcis lilfordi]
MKLSSTSFSFLFLAAPFALAAVCPLEPAKETQDVAHKRANCCLNYVNRPIPCKAIKYYERASSTCAKPAVIVYLKKKNRKLCVDPSKEWVQKILKCFPPPS